jgi:uncharacterized protein (UPF0335 family)
MTTTGHNSNAQLRSIVERIENQEVEKAAIADGIKDIYAEAESAGYDTKAIRAIIRRRKQNAADLKAHEEMIDAYMVALGDFANSPLGQAAIARAVA